MAAHAKAGEKQTFTVVAGDAEADNDALKFYADIARVGKLTLSANGANQIEPGGVVTYRHTLANLSNSDIDKTITLSGAGLPADWSYMIFETNEEGVIESNKQGQTSVNIDSLTIDATRYFTVRVMAPATALAGSRQILTLTAEVENDEFNKTSVTDTTTVISGQVRLYKRVIVLGPDGNKKSDDTNPVTDFSSTTEPKATTEAEINSKSQSFS